MLISYKMNPETFYSNTEICRVCPRTVNLINLYDLSNKKVLNDLNLIVYIENEDVTLLPKFICQICKTSLKHFMEFKIQCEERDKEMRENIRLSQSSKATFKTEHTEISDIEDNYGNNEVESYVENMESVSEAEDSNNSVKEDNHEENSTTEIDDKNIVLLNQLKDRESETIYNDFKEILETIPLTRKVKTRQCVHCEAIFETAIKCSEHILSEHGGSGSYKYNCIVCNKEFLSWTELSEHKRADHKKCTECPKVFGTYPLMRDHFRRVHINKPKEDTNQRFPCKLCGKIFKLKASIGKHIRSYHNNERLHHCEICGKGFFEIGQFRSHQVTHTDERPIICDLPDCGKTFKSVKDLKSHKVSHLPPEKRKIKEKSIDNLYICSYCGKQLHTKNGHDLHLRIHTNEMPHKCPVCNKMFRYPHSLWAHKRIHTNEKPYHCGICDLSFRQKTHLISHQLVHQNEKKYSCQLCNMSTKFKQNLLAHMRNVHLAERNFQCEFCEEQYFSKSMLTKHLLLKHKDVQLNIKCENVI